MDAGLLTATVDDVIAAPNPAPLERLLAEVPLVAGAAVVELADGLLPALPDDTESWARVDELGSHVRALAAAPFSRVARDLGDGMLVVCAAFGEHTRVLVGPPSGDGRLVLLVTAGAAWRIVVGPDGSAPALVGDVAALADRLAA